MLTPHFSYFQNAFSCPKLLYTLRSAPCYHLHDSLFNMDEELKTCVQTICNINPDELSWQQLTLPVRHGGLGLTTPIDVALPAFISSVTAGKTLTSEILSNFTEPSVIPSYAAALSTWSEMNYDLPPIQNNQRAWCEVAYSSKSDKLASHLDQHRLACLRAGREPHSGSWLQALPSAFMGTLLDNNTLRVSLSLRLGIRQCKQHRCRCGNMVDEFGLHPLSCRMNSGRFPSTHSTERHC